MKIRIRGNSVRFRLTKSEVKTLCEMGFVEEKTNFNESFFSYSIKASEEHEDLHATFRNDSVILFMPKGLLSDWETNEKVGFYHTQSNRNGSALTLTLEKDFVCMDETVEDQSDNYPNPKMM